MRNDGYYLPLHNPLYPLPITRNGLARELGKNTLFAGPWSCQEHFFARLAILGRLEMVKEAIVIGRKAERVSTSAKGVDETGLRDGIASQL